jgi:acetoin utilization deacetylase AcuC-like enzyme
MATDQMQILPTKPYDLIMNWRTLGLNCASCGGTGRVKFLKDGQPFCQYCATNTAPPPPVPKGYTVKVFYDERQTVGFNDSFSPSASKPAKVVASWQRLGIPLELCSFAPLTIDDMCLAHDRNYVEGVLAYKYPNGFGSFNPEVALALPWVCGSMVASVLHSLNSGELSFSPTSGAHHACYNHGMCYCTFNFLAMAAIRAHQEGAKTVGIIDLDNHHGNGTENIITTLGLNFIKHYSFGKECLQRGAAAKDWLRRLPGIVRRFDDVDLLIVNAGVDPHVADPLGGVLTTRELAERDQIVFSLAAEMGRKVSVSLAGGYQQDEQGNIDAVLQLHDTTFKLATAAFGTRHS